MYEWMQLLMSGFLGNVLDINGRSGPKQIVACRSSCEYNSHLVIHYVTVVYFVALLFWYDEFCCLIFNISFFFCAMLNQTSSHIRS